MKSRGTTQKKSANDELLKILHADDDLDAAVAVERARFEALDRRLRRKAWVDKNVNGQGAS